MPISGPGILSVVWPKLVAQVPTLEFNWRFSSNPTIPPHNPMREMLLACCNAWYLVISSGSVTNTYTGTAGVKNVSTPAAILLPASPGMGGTLIGLMGWFGPMCVPLANSLTTEIGLATSQFAQYVADPVPGGGQGTGLILPQNQVALAGLSGAFYVALKSSFMANRYFTVMDTGTVLTPQIDILLGVLSGLYATMLSSVITVSPIIYSGPTAPSAMVNPAAKGRIV